jgi:hypothetical protein
MGVYNGSCHCGAVQFEVSGPIERLLLCNCSICTKKGITHIPVTDDHFTLTAGEEHLSTYTFGSGDARHWFCSRCGIQPFGRPRNDPTRYTVNARCLDDYESLLSALPTVTFDGRNHPKDQL